MLSAFVDARATAEVTAFYRDHIVCLAVFGHYHMIPSSESYSAYKFSELTMASIISADSGPPALVIAPR